MDDLYKQLKRFGKVKTNVPLARYTTFQIGGPTKFFVTVDETDKLVGLLNFLSGEGIDYLVMGGGSNLLFSDEGFDGVVIKIATYTLTHLHTYTLQSDAGVKLGAVLNMTMQNALTGFEWAAGVPGTVGGAVRGNAGAYGGSTGNSVLKIEVWENGEVREMTKEECGFGYRGSDLKKNHGIVVLRAWFQFVPGDKIEIVSKVQGFLQRRKNRFPPYPSAGCFFANIKLDKWPGDKSILLPKFFEINEVPAGWMVEQVGAMGLRVGGAMVSDKHGNFIINVDKATQADVLSLVAEVSERVYNKFGVELTKEVEII